MAKAKGIVSGIDRQKVREEGQVANMLAQVRRGKVNTRIKDQATRRENMTWQ